jgi:hypothetical protein
MKLYLYGALAIALTAFGLWGWLGHNQVKLLKKDNAALVLKAQGYSDALDASLKEAARLEQVDAERRKRIRELTALIAVQRKELRAAIQNNPVWASTPVPDSVWDALGAPRDGQAPAEPSVDRSGPSTPTPGAG